MPIDWRMGPALDAHPEPKPSVQAAVRARPPIENKVADWLM